MGQKLLWSPFIFPTLPKYFWTLPNDQTSENSALLKMSKSDWFDWSFKFKLHEREYPTCILFSKSKSAVMSLPQHWYLVTRMHILVGSVDGTSSSQYIYFLGITYWHSLYLVFHSPCPTAWEESVHWKCSLIVVKFSLDELAYFIHSTFKVKIDMNQYNYKQGEKHLQSIES